MLARPLWTSVGVLLISAFANPKCKSSAAVLAQEHEYLVESLRGDCSSSVGKHSGDEDVSLFMQIPLLSGQRESTQMQDALQQQSDALQAGEGASPHTNAIDAELDVYHGYAKSVRPQLGRCDCTRMDSRNFSGQQLPTGPTIFTHVLDGWGEELRSSWTRDELLRKGGGLMFSVSDLKHNGAGPYIAKIMPNSTLTLAQILGMEQPGNLFVNKEHDVAKLLLDTTAPWTLPPQASRLREILRLPSINRYISLGSRAQWNHVHIHSGFLFTQVKGSKGWVVAPPQAFQRAKQEMVRANEFDHLHLHDLDQSDVCGPFSARLAKDAGLIDSQEINGAKWNLTEYGSCCQVNEGEAFYVPGRTHFDGWWHGTCDLEDWNAGWTWIGAGL